MTQIPTPSQLRERQAAQRLADTETAVAAIVEALEAHYVGSPLSVSDQRDGASVKIRELTGADR